MRTRTWKTLTLAALLGPALMFAGCKGDGEPAGGDDGGSTGTTLAQPVTIVESVNGNSQALKTIGAMLIRTQAEYDALGDKNIFPGELDFDQHDLVIVALGEQNTGGYSVDITSIQLDGSELAIKGKATKPAADAIVTQALTYPYDAVLIANTTATSVVPYID